MPDVGMVVAFRAVIRIHTRRRTLCHLLDLVHRVAAVGSVPLQQVQLLLLAVVSAAVVVVGAELEVVAVVDAE